MCVCSCLSLVENDTRINGAQKRREREEKVDSEELGTKCGSEPGK